VDSGSGVLKLSQLAEDLLVFRKASELLLREDQLPVHGDFEDPATAFDQARLYLEFLIDGSCQTGSLRKVVSSDAVLDPYLHLNLHHGFSINA
jgi:hypothetical protein